MTRRRRVLRAGAGLTGVALAGCLSDLMGGGTSEPPTVAGRPDAVYYPSHVEGMEMAGMAMPGPYEVALAYSYPHRFWLVTGQEREQVAIQDGDAVHLMATVWDPETGTVLPVGDVSVKATKDGESVLSKSMWPMLSQNMGLHFGDNVGLAGNGTYEVSVTVAPVGARRTGAFQGRFGERASGTVEFEFDHGTLQEVPFQQLDDKRGQRGAVDPMQMEMMPLARTPAPDALPGSVVGEGESGDATVVVTALDSPPESVDGDGYLAVSLRTPYHRYPIPFTSLSATLTRDGEAVFDDALTPTLDPDLGYHYGAVATPQTGDELTVSVGAPPQLARHEGYETAFFEMDDVSMTV